MNINILFKETILWNKNTVHIWEMEENQDIG